MISAAELKYHFMFLTNHPYYLTGHFMFWDDFYETYQKLLVMGGDLVANQPRELDPANYFKNQDLITNIIESL